MTVTRRCLLHWMPTLFCATVIASCGGSGSSGTAGGGNNGGGSGVVTLGATSIQESEVSVDVWMQDGVDALRAYADADGDGLQDSVDPNPNAKPSMSESFGSDALQIVDMWSAIDGQRAPGAIVQNAPLMLRMQGLSAVGTEPVWLVYQTQWGLRAVEAEQVAADLLRANVRERTGYVHVVVGVKRTGRHAVVYLNQDAPVLFSDATVHGPGEVVMLRGRNLERITAATLGRENVTLLSTAFDQARVRLPSAPSSNVFAVEENDAVSNTVDLDIRQDVTVSVDPQLLLPGGQYLVYWYGSERRTLASGETFAVSLPATAPVVLTFDVEGPAGIRFYTVLHAVVWPGEAATVVSARNTMLARLLRNRKSLPDGDGDNWTELRAALVRGLDTPAALNFYADMYALLAYGTDFQRENGVHDAMTAYRELAEQEAAANSQFSLTASDIRTGPDQFLDDYIGSTIALATAEGADADADAGADYAFRRLETIGNDYSQILVQSHEGVRNIFTVPTECSFGGSEQEWRNTHFLWRSDLCMQLDGQVYVSYALIKPGLSGDIEAILDDVAAGNEPFELLHRHATPGSLKSDHIFGPGGYYLKDDANNPQCRMETCYVEFLTGGYSGGSQVALTSRQEAVVNTLRARMWADIISSVLISKLAGIDFSKLPVSDKDATNFRKCVEGNFVQTIAKTGLMADAAVLIGGTAAIHKAATQDEYTAQIFSQFTTKLGGWLENFAKGQLSEPFFLSCLTAPLKAELPTTEILQDRINANLEVNLAEPLGIRYGKFSFEEIYEFVKAAGSIYLTPEKFLFRMDPRARVTAVTPDTLDLNNSTDVFLRIRGNWLAQTSCAEPGWCPEMVIEDRYGNTLRYPVTADQVSYPDNLISDVQIRIRVDDIPGLQALAPGALNIWFEYQPRQAEPLAYNSYPDDRLRVPVPDLEGALLLLTRPKLIGFKTPAVQAGKELVAVGTGLTRYGNAPRYELVDPDPFQPPAVASVPLTIVQSGAGTDPDSEVRLQLPDDVISGYYKLLMGADPDFGPGAPTEGVLSDTVVAVTRNNEYAALVVMDLGEFKDDAMEVVYYDSGTNGGTRLGSFPVPANADNDLNKSFINGIEWRTDAPLQDQLYRIEINCTDGGPDKVCSFAVRSQQFFMCAPGTGTKDVWDGVIDTGDKQELWFSEAFDLYNCPPL